MRPPSPCHCQDAKNHEVFHPGSIKFALPTSHLFEKTLQEGRQKNLKSGFLPSMSLQANLGQIPLPSILLLLPGPLMSEASGYPVSESRLHYRKFFLQKLKNPTAVGDAMEKNFMTCSRFAFFILSCNSVL